MHRAGPLVSRRRQRCGRSTAADRRAGPGRDSRTHVRQVGDRPLSGLAKLRLRSERVRSVRPVRVAPTAPLERHGLRTRRGSTPELTPDRLHYGGTPLQAAARLSGARVRMSGQRDPRRRRSERAVEFWRLHSSIRRSLKTEQRTKKPVRAITALAVHPATCLRRVDGQVRE